MGHFLLILLHLVCLFSFWAGLLLTVPLHLIYAVMSSRRNAAEQREQDAQRELSQMVRCTECRELVRWDAVKCRHCGAALTPSAAPPSPPGNDDGARYIAIAVATIAGMFMLAYGCSSLGK